MKSAARGGRPPTLLIPVPCFLWRSATTTSAGCSMGVATAVTAAAAAAAAAATTPPAITTHGEMQPVLEHCCDPLIRGSDAGGVRGEEKRFSGWISLLNAGKNVGDGLRAEGETMDGREQTPSGMGSGVDLELYVDSYFSSRDTNRRSVSGGVVICAGACVIYFFS